MKNTFTSRGYIYNVLDTLSYGYLYFGNSASSMTDDYLTDCVNALGVSFSPQKDDKGETIGFSVFVSPVATEDEVFEEVLTHLSEDLEETIPEEFLKEIKELPTDDMGSEDYATAFTAYCITENIVEITKRKFKPVML